jgi:hypothetical protein
VGASAIFGARLILVSRRSTTQMCETCCLIGVLAKPGENGSFKGLLRKARFGRDDAENAAILMERNYFIHLSS